MIQMVFKGHQLINLVPSFSPKAYIMVFWSVPILESSFRIIKVFNENFDIFKRQTGFKRFKMYICFTFF